MCSNPGQEMIVKDIKDHEARPGSGRGVQPRMHEPTFRTAMERAGFNPYFLEMANIREQCSWVHEDRETATDKAKALTCAAIGG